MTGKIRRYLKLMRQRGREGHCSPARQLLELAYLRAVGGMFTSDYYAAGLYRSTISWSAKKDYISRKTYDRFVARFNDPLFDFVAQNKVVTNGVLATFGVPTPRVFGLLNRVDGQACDGAPLRTADDVDALVRRHGLDELCFKPVGAWGGHGFLKVRFQRKSQLMVALHNEKTFVPLQDFWTARLYPKGGPSYLCQGVIQQHPELAEIHPASINTARVWMFQLKRGEWRVYDAILRMGIGSMMVDNTSSGGIASHIDVAHGTLGEAIDMTYNRVTSDTHPTTHVRLTGRTLPMWKDVVTLCHRTCRAFPYLRLLGLDVAFGKDSPLIIEVESHPDPVHQIAVGHGLRPLVRALAAEGRLDWRA